jgi:basic membrane protein A
MSKKLMFVLAIVVMASFVLGACAPKAGTTTATTKIKACEVTDMGGIDDKSFNAAGWKGVTDAIDQLGIEGVYLQSNQETDYANNVNAFLTQNCDLIIGIGYLLGDAIKAAAEANPTQKFAIVDFTYDPLVPNVRTSAFNIDHATFLAGYLAAGMTTTGKVGTYGGIQIPPVTLFMDGFYLGVQKYNEDHGTTVEVLGWDPTTQTGSFTGDFSNTDNGKTVTLAMLDQGADIIMPVAGPVGQGTLAALRERGTGTMIGVDTDWSAFYPDYADVILASAMKGVDLFVFQSIQKVIDGTFVAAGELWTGDLDNGGVGLKYGSTWESQIPADLKTAIDDLSTAILAGTIQTKP